MYSFEQEMSPKAWNFNNVSGAKSDFYVEAGRREAGLWPSGQFCFRYPGLCPRAGMRDPFGIMLTKLALLGETPLASTFSPLAGRGLEVEADQQKI
jgi:hypothetical protein